MASTLSLSRIGFGSAALANGPDWDWTTSISEAQAVECIQVAYARGIRFFDTAPSYGMGEAERRLGIGLKGLPRDTFIVATKVGYTCDSAGIHYDYSREGVLRSLDASLKKLHLDHVDILHIHDPDHHIHQVLKETFPVLAELREQGVIGKISAGMNQWQVPLQLAQEAEFDLFMIAGRYTLLEQGALPLLDYCAAHKIDILAAAIYNSGILATGVHHPHARYNHAPVPAEIRARTAAIQTICDTFGVSLHAAATQFPLAHAAVRSAVVGFQTTQEIEQCLNALQVSIPAAFWERLRQEEFLDDKVPVPTDKAVSS
jgi:D-threo-aldose 1-dehydrogenase